MKSKLFDYEGKSLLAVKSKLFDYEGKGCLIVKAMDVRDAMNYIARQPADYY